MTLDEAIEAAVKAYREHLVASMNVRINDHIDLCKVDEFWGKYQPAKTEAEKALTHAEQSVRAAADTERQRRLKELGL